MNLHRREWLGLASAALLGGGLSGWGRPGIAATEDYRALVVIHLNGGNDGSNCLVPLDGAYGDYERTRGNLALAKDSVLPIPGEAAGQRFGVHPALAPLVGLYEQQRLGFVANVGPLIEPSTAATVFSGAVRVPPFLGSHSDQTAISQGWGVSEDQSGWAGRGLELLPSRLRHVRNAFSWDTNRTLVQGRRSPVSFLDTSAGSWWGIGDLLNPQGDEAIQTLDRMRQLQSANAYEAEYARSFSQGFEDATAMAQALALAKPPSQDFGSTEQIATGLRSLASVLPVYKAQGLRRQAFLLSWGGFDTHANQRGSGALTQDAQLAHLAKALAAFDGANRAAGLDANIVTLVMSEFGRTLRPGSGGGSEHGWGNHWWLMGGPVSGGSVVGRFPSLLLGGPDDGDEQKNGRLVPSLSSDQVGATLMQWLGLDSSALLDVFPLLANFPTKTLPLLRA